MQNKKLHSIYITKKDVTKIGIMGLNSLIIFEKIISKILKNNIQENFGIDKIIQLNFLNKNVGRIYSLIIFQKTNEKLAKEFFQNFGIHFFSSKKDFSKNIDYRNFIFLKQTVIYEKPNFKEYLI